MSPQSAGGRRVSRMMGLGIFFLVCCLLYLGVFAVMELNSENIKGHAGNGTTERTVIVQAMRGQIYDRNGKPLVTNEYTYHLTVDYSVLPTDTHQRNEILLKALEVLYACGEGDRFMNYRYPLQGVYPDVSYSAAAETEGTADYETLLKQFSSSGLRDRMIRGLKAQGMSTKEATAAFDEAPLSYITAQKLVDYFFDQYGLLDTDGDGKQL